MDDLYLYNMGHKCPYCHGDTEFVDSREVYGTSYGMIYICRPCGAWVGVHKGTSRALGRLANEDLRKYKKLAHACFDLVWKAYANMGHSPQEARKEAYTWLGGKLGMDPENTHIGMMDIAQCKAVMKYSYEEYIRMITLDRKAFVGHVPSEIFVYL